MTEILVLRPEPGASATAARAADLGMRATVAPLFEVRALPWTSLPLGEGTPDALMLTSANAVRHAGPELALYRALPVYAVGEATAAAARDAGFARIRTGPADAAAMLDMMARDGIAHALHLAGREHRAVAHPAVTISRRIVYAADPIAALPPAIEDRIVLLHSPRAAAHFAALVEQGGRRRVSIALAAISSATAEAAGPGWRALAIAATPDDAALLAAAATLCD